MVLLWPSSIGTMGLPKEFGWISVMIISIFDRHQRRALFGWRTIGLVDPPLGDDLNEERSCPKPI